MSSNTAREDFFADLSDLIQRHLDTGRLPILDAREILEFYVLELEVLAHAVEVEDKLVAKGLRIAGRLT